MCLVRVDGCDYSVPSKYAYQDVVVRKYVDHIQIIYACMMVVTHVRAACGQKYQLDPWHYLDVLERKPGALQNGRPFMNDAFGADLTLLRRELEQRYESDGTKQFINVLLLAKKHPIAEVCEAVSRCVEIRAFSVDAVECMLRNQPLDATRERLNLSNQPELQNFGDGIRSAADYDLLYQLQATSLPSERINDDDSTAAGGLPEDIEITHHAA
jgi:hypothetical protein